MSFSGKSITQQDYRKLINDVSSDMAIPELKFKFDLFMDLNEFKKSWNEFQVAYLLNKGVVGSSKKYQAIADVLRVFNDIKFMVFQKRAWNIHYRGCRNDGKLVSLDDMRLNINKGVSCDFDLMSVLDKGVRDFHYNELLRLKDYVLWCLHVCNLTNLLRADGREDVLSMFKDDLGV